MNKYKVTKALEKRDWKIGDIVLMDERSSKSVSEYVEKYEGDENHKHVAITVDPVKLSTVINQ